MIKLEKRKKRKECLLGINKQSCPARGAVREGESVLCFLQAPRGADWTGQHEQNPIYPYSTQCTVLNTRDTAPWLQSLHGALTPFARLPTCATCEHRTHCTLLFYRKAKGYRTQYSKLFQILLYYSLFSAVQVTVQAPKEVTDGQTIFLTFLFIILPSPLPVILHRLQKLSPSCPPSPPSKRKPPIMPPSVIRICLRLHTFRPP